MWLNRSLNHDKRLIYSFISPSVKQNYIVALYRGYKTVNQLSSDTPFHLTSHPVIQKLDLAIIASVMYVTKPCN